MKPICIGCGCDEEHGCDIQYFNGLMENCLRCWWVRFDVANRVGVCSACWDLVKVWDAAKELKPIYPLIAERYYRQVLFLYDDKPSALAWLHSPQALLGNRSPYELILAGELDRVQTMVAQIRDGAYI